MSNLSLPTELFGDSAREMRVPLCRNCGWNGSLVDARDRTDTTYADESTAHAAATGHHLIGDLKITYSPGQIVDLGATSRMARRTLGGRGR